MWFVSLAFGVYAQTVTLSGFVKDSVYQTPVANAIVSVNGARLGMITNEAGEFSFDAPLDSLASNTLTVFAPGYRIATVPMKADHSYLIVSLSPVPKETSPGIFGEGKNGSPSPFNRFVGAVANIIINDWIPLGNPETNKFDFGRVQRLASINPVEGLRIQPGIASTTRLNPHFFVKGYTAYGFKDKKFKYRGEVVYSFNDKVYHDQEYPKHNLSFVYENDVFAFGEMHPRALNDLLLVTYRRSKNAMLYRRFTEVNFEKESLSGFAYQVWFRNSGMRPVEGLDFIRMEQDGSLSSLPKLTTSEVATQLRYSFGENYEQNRRKRKLLTPEKPAIFLSHLIGLDGSFAGSGFYHRTEISVQKRFSLGKYGRMDAVAEAQKIWNRVPFPLLLYPNQRNKYQIENNAFFLTPALEFAGDEQYMLRTTFVGDQLLFHRVPVLRKLGFRELFSIRSLTSRLSEKNIPTRENGLLIFPEGTMRMGATPYVEAAIGITNILGLLRVEYVHRLTYRDNPGALLGKVRVDVTL